uniref:Uncharacterized protein n=1 Tax=Anguilla anguilla TaxID=7936 RepID=A0A0E9R5E6_ANGAN
MTLRDQPDTMLTPPLSTELNKYIHIKNYKIAHRKIYTVAMDKYTQNK